MARDVPSIGYSRALCIWESPAAWAEEFEGWPEQSASMPGTVGWCAGSPGHPHLLLHLLEQQLLLHLLPEPATKAFLVLCDHVFR